MILDRLMSRREKQARDLQSAPVMSGSVKTSDVLLGIFLCRCWTMLFRPRKRNRMKLLPSSSISAFWHSRPMVPAARLDAQKAYPVWSCQSSWRSPPCRNAHGVQLPPAHRYPSHWLSAWDCNTAYFTSATARPGFVRRQCRTQESCSATMVRSYLATVAGPARPRRLWGGWVDAVTRFRANSTAERREIRVHQPIRL